MLRHLRSTIVLTALAVSFAAPAEAGVCDQCLHHIRRIFGRDDSHVAADVSPTAHAAEAAAAQATNAFVPDLAENYGERRAKAWITENKCLSCHTILPHTITHFSGASADAESMQQIRQYIASRVDNWDAASPWYDGSKAAESKGSELIISSFVLTQSEEAGAAGKERMLKTVRLMSAMQDTDGAFPWLNYNLEPFESKEARTYGAALAAISYGQLSADERTEFAPQIEKVRDYLKKTWDKSGVTEIDQLHIAWADMELDGIINKSELTQAMKKIAAKQNDDGGWSINQISKWKKQGSSPVSAADASDPYATAYTLFVMKKTGIKDEAEFSDVYKKGVAWLKSHQNSSGAWDTVSLNSDNPTNNLFATDYASGFAWAVLKGR